MLLKWSTPYATNVEYFIKPAEYFIIVFAGGTTTRGFLETPEKHGSGSKDAMEAFRYFRSIPKSLNKYTLFEFESRSDVAEKRPRGFFAGG